MDELKVLKEAFDTGTPPAGADMKKFQKLLKKYGHLDHPRFVRLYPVRDCRYEGDIYRVFAFSVSGETVDSDILGVIKEEVATLPVGSIRYNAAEAGSHAERLSHTGRMSGIHRARLWDGQGCRFPLLAGFRRQLYVGPYHVERPVQYGRPRPGPA